MSDIQISGAEIVIKKNQGITYALLDLVKKQPNSVLKDGKITLEQWQNTMDKLSEIRANRAKSKNAGDPIFTGNTDKTKAGWHSSFVVHPNQKIKFTADEMKSLYAAMGVTFKKTADKRSDASADTAKTDASDNKNNTDKNKNIEKADEKEKTDAAKKAEASDKPENTSKTEAPKEENVSKNADDAKTGNSDKRHSLSWSQIGKIAGESAKNFVKGMFCDENGFSIGRTAATVGTVAVLAFAAPAAAAAGASAAVVGGIAMGAKLIGAGIGILMAGNGTVNAVKGTKAYLNSKTEEEAKESMTQAMDGAVEVAAAVPTFFALKGITNKTGKSAVKKAQAKKSNSAPAEPKPAEPKPAEPNPAEPKPAEPKPAEPNPAEPKPAEPKPAEPKPAEPNPAEPAPVQPGAAKTPEEQLIAKLFKKDVKPIARSTNSDDITTISYRSGRHWVEVKKDADGNIIKYIETKRNLLDTKEVSEIKDANGNLIERNTDIMGLFTGETKVYTTEYADGRVITTKYYSNGNLKESVIKKADGTTTVEKFDKNGNRISKNAEKTQNKQSEQNNGEPKIITYDDSSSLETYIDAKGRKIKAVSKNADGSLYYEEVTTYKADGTKTEITTWGDKSTNECVYNKDGNVIKEIQKHPDGQLRYEKVINYNADGKEAELLTWADKSTIESIYNKDGIIIKEIQKNPDGQLTSEKLIKYNADKTKTHLTTLADKSTKEYIYNKDGEIIKVIQKNPEGQLTSEKLIKYNADGKEAELITWADKSSTEHIYNKDGYKTRIIHKDANNNLLGTEHFTMFDSSGRPIESLYEFPNGLKYKFQVKNGEKVSEGIGINPDGTRFKAKFENNKFSQIE